MFAGYFSFFCLRLSRSPRRLPIKPRQYLNGLNFFSLFVWNLAKCLEVCEQNKTVPFSVCWLRNERTGMLWISTFVWSGFYSRKRETVHLSFSRHNEFFIYFAVLKMCCLGRRAAALVHSSLGVSHIKGKEPSAWTNWVFSQVKKKKPNNTQIANSRFSELHDCFLLSDVLFFCKTWIIRYNPQNPHYTTGIVVKSTFLFMNAITFHIF